MPGAATGTSNPRHVEAIMRRKIAACPFLSLFLILLCGDAHAYVDPTTHSTLIQVLSAIFILVSAGYVFLKNQIARIFRSLSRLLRRLVP
jgi:hypothetical protein